MKLSTRHSSGSVRRWSRSERFLLVSPLLLLALVGGGLWLRRLATRRLQSLAYLPDGNIVCAFRDTSVLVRDGRTGRDLRRLGTQRPENALAFALSPDGQSVAVQGSHNYQAVLMDTKTGAVQHTLNTRRKIWAYQTAFSADGALTAIQNGSTADIYDARSGKLLGFIEDTGNRSVFAFRDQKTAIAATNDVMGSNSVNKLGVRDLRTGAWLQRWKPGSAPIGSIVLSPNGRIAATSSSAPYGPDPIQTQEIRLYDTRTGRVLQALQPNGWFCNLAFSPDGTRLAGCMVGTADVHVWEVATRQKLFVVTHETAFNSDKSIDLAWSPDGNTLLTGSANDVLCLWDGHTGRQKQFAD